MSLVTVNKSATYVWEVYINESYAGLVVDTHVQESNGVQRVYIIYASPDGTVGITDHWRCTLKLKEGVYGFTRNN